MTTKEIEKLVHCVQALRLIVDINILPRDVLANAKEILHDANKVLKDNPDMKPDWYDI